MAKAKSNPPKNEKSQPVFEESNQVPPAPVTRSGCDRDTDGDGNCPVHPEGCPPAVEAAPVTTAAVPPSVGRIVHYILPTGSPRAGEHRAAVITSNCPRMEQNLTLFLEEFNDLPADAISSDRIKGVQLMTPEPCYFARAWAVPYEADGKTPGTWHWPERV